MVSRCLSNNPRPIRSCSCSHCSGIHIAFYFGCWRAHQRATLIHTSNHSWNAGARDLCGVTANRAARVCGHSAQQELVPQHRRAHLLLQAAGRWGAHQAGSRRRMDSFRHCPDSTSGASATAAAICHPSLTACALEWSTCVYNDSNNRCCGSVFAAPNSKLVNASSEMVWHHFCLILKQLETEVRRFCHGRQAESL